MSDQVQTDANDQAQPSTAFDNIPDQFIPLNKLGIAPENLRADDPADDDIPQLADTLFYAGQVHPVLVRPGKGRKEDEFMALDGRRRRFAWLHNVELGRIPADQPIRVKVITDRAQQIAAATLPNTEQAPPDLVHVIRATGRLVKRKMSPADIAKALGGYSLQEVRGWAVLADLEDEVLERLRDGKISLRQAKLMTKLSPQDQKQLADHASIYGRLYDDAVRARLNGAIITVGDARVRLVGLDAYTAAGGRVESDLFGETPDMLLDQGVLQQVWDEKVKAIVEHLTAAGLQVFFDAQSHFPPEGFEALPHLFNIDVPDDLEDAVNQLDGERTTAAAALRDLETIGDQNLDRVLTYLSAEIDYLQMLGLKLGACNLIPDGRLGVRATFFAHPQPEPEQAEGGDDQSSAPNVTYQSEDDGVRRYGDVDVPRVTLAPEVTSHSLVERYTDLATRGLIRSLADDPNAALVLLVARLFVTTTLQFSGCGDDRASITTLKGQAYRRPGHEPVAALDGEVFERLEQRRVAYLESGQRPIPWVASLSHGERMTFLAELMAISLDGREFATHAPRHGARAEALELVELTGHDIRNYWLPDIDFFSAHNKGQMLGMLEKMGEETGAAASLKKGDLAARVTAASGDHHWAPEALSWKANAPVEAELEPADGEPSLVDGDAPTAANCDAVQPSDDASVDAPAEDLPAAA